MPRKNLGVLTREQINERVKAAFRGEYQGTFISFENEDALARYKMALPKLDAKFYGEIRKAKDDSVVPDDEYIVFLAKDTAFALVLPIYVELCKVLGCDQEQIDAITAVQGRVESWRIVHGDRCKLPDAKDEKLLEVK